MSKKFFSLIHGEKIHIAPGTKVIPADSVATIMDAREVLGLVKSDAEKYKMEVAADCEKIKEHARKEGFEKGYAEWTDKIADLEAEIKKVRKETENVIIPIALKAAKKIVGRELEQSEETVVDIISNSLKAVASHKRIKIFVNKKEFELVENRKERLKGIFEKLESLNIIPQNDIEPAGCIIETEGGIINAQLENQWMILENAFEKLLAPKKGAEAPSEEEIQKEVAEQAAKEEPPPAAEAPKPAEQATPEEKTTPPVDDEEEEWEKEEEEWEEEEDEWEEDEWDEDEDEEEEDEEKT